MMVIHVESPRKTKKCPVCGSTDLEYDQQRGEIICRKCGEVVEHSLVDFSPEWRVFENDRESRKRVGSPISASKYDYGVSTQIGSASDIAGLTPEMRKITGKMKMWQERTPTAMERNVKAALSELRRAASVLHLPQRVVEEASRIYRKAAERGLVRGRSIESVVAGAVYAACRLNSIPRTLDEIATAFHQDKKDIGKTYRFIARELGIKILPTSPVDYVYRFANEMGLTQKVVSRAIKIIKEANKREITSGKGPMGIAAAALYIAALLEGEKKTQREVADVAGVTEVTIRNRYKELVEKLGLEKKLRKIKAE